MRLTKFLETTDIRIDMHRLDDQLTSEFWSVVDALKKYGFETRIVGGAIRDLLLGGSPRDIDLATNALPDEIIWVMQKHDFDLTTKGITHGTIKVRFPGRGEENEFEITSLSYGIHDRGGKLEIHHDSDWRADAQRRDFSLNALSMDMDGHVYDYVGGLKDLRDHRIRFLTPIGEKIEDTPVLILRFFKLVSKLTDPEFDPTTIDAIQKYKGEIDKVDPDRIRWELQNIHKGANAKEASKLMRQIGVSKIVSKLISS